MCETVVMRSLAKPSNVDDASIILKAAFGRMSLLGKARLKVGERGVVNGFRMCICLHMFGALVSR